LSARIACAGAARLMMDEVVSRRPHFHESGKQTEGT
jgi:hypothetical protein